MTRNKVPLNGNDIQALLEALGAELAKRFDEPLEILVIGGACLILTEGNRATTTDVDVLPLNTSPWSSVLEYSPGPVEKAVVDAIKVVARKKKLGSDWINDDTNFLHGGLDGHVQVRRSDCRLWGVYGQLHVYMPPLSYMLACKVFAGRKKDRDDTWYLIERLGIQTRAELQSVVDRHIPREYQREYQLHKTIEFFFP